MGRFVDEIRARLEKRTQGEWQVTELADDEIHVTVGYSYENGIHKANWIADIHAGEDDTTHEERTADAWFIANAPDDIRALLELVEDRTKDVQYYHSENESLRAEVKRLREALEWYGNPTRYAAVYNSGTWNCAASVDAGRRARQAIQGGGQE